MIKIIPANQFKLIPWKNGKGQTSELAISDMGTIDKFDWRLSIADVIEDGEFSNFSGYERNLILLEGQGIKLTHNIEQLDLLDKFLSISSFNGASKTIGQLINGPIKDFNLMTKQGKYKVDIKTFVETNDLQIDNVSLCFVYSHHSPIFIRLDSGESIIPKGHLGIINNESKLALKANGFILIHLTNKTPLN